MVDSDGLVMAVTTAAANCHDSKPLSDLLNKANIRPKVCIHTDNACSSQKDRDVLKSRGIKNGIQDKAAKNDPLFVAQGGLSAGSCHPDFGRDDDKFKD